MTLENRLYERQMRMEEIISKRMEIAGEKMAGTDPAQTEIRQ